MAERRHRDHSIHCKLSQAEYAQLCFVREKLSLSTAEILMLGVRRAASRYAAEQRRQRRLEGQDGA